MMEELGARVSISSLIIDMGYSINSDNTNVLFI